MPTTTTYGYKKPITGERGTWWQNLIDNITRTDAHTHNNIDSAPIPTKNLDKSAQSVSAAGWAATSGQAGTFQQTVTLPAGYDMATVAMKFIVNGGAEDGAEFYPTTEKLTATTFRIYANDNTLAFKVLYA